MNEVSEEVVRQTAYIMGPNSAAARALADAQRYKDAFPIVRFCTDRHTIFVFGCPAKNPAKQRTEED